MGFGSTGSNTRVENQQVRASGSHPLCPWHAGILQSPTTLHPPRSSYMELPDCLAPRSLLSWGTAWPALLPQPLPRVCQQTPFSPLRPCTRVGPHLPRQQGQSPDGCVEGADLLRGSRDEGRARVQDGRTALSTESQPPAHLHAARGKGAVIRGAGTALSPGLCPRTLTAACGPASRQGQ